MSGQRVEGGLDLMLIGGQARRGAKAGEKSAAEPVAGEQPMQIAAGDEAVGADRSFLAARDT
jgi:hypothetical protein